MFVVDTDRTELDVEVHPSLFGFRVRITGLHGEVEGDLRPDGTVDLSSTIGAHVTMNINDLDLGNPLLTRTTHGALGLAGDGSVDASLVDVGESDLPADGSGQAFTFTFEVESGNLRGRLGASARVAPNRDGSVTVAGTTEFRATDFDVHLPGLGHLRGVCHWTVVVRPRA